MSSSRFLTAALTAACTFGLGLTASATTIDPANLAGNADANLAAIGDVFASPSGNVSNDGWSTSGLSAGTNAGYPGFPGSGAWPAPIASDSGDDAGLHKIANGTGGGPYPASGSIYYGGFSGDINNNGGTLAVRDTTPLADVATIAFQIEIGEAWTYDFFNDELPSLLIDGTSYQASHSALIEQFYNGTVPMPTGDEDVYINTYLLAWDLTAAGLNLTSPVTSFDVQFTGVQHAQVYSLRLDQSDVAIVWPSADPDPIDPDATAAMPEPATASLMAIGGLVLLARRRRNA